MRRAVDAGRRYPGLLSLLGLVWRVVHAGCDDINTWASTGTAQFQNKILSENKYLMACCDLVM